MSTENQEQSQEQGPPLQLDDNKIIAERRVKLAADSRKRHRLPERLRPAAQGGRPARETYGGWTREELEAEPQPWCWPAA
jgi:lysyl-tRNA synthetase class 2